MGKLELSALNQERGQACAERHPESNSHCAGRNHYGRQDAMRADVAGDHELAAVLGKRMREIAREVFREAAHNYVSHSNAADAAPGKLREQIALIKAKEHITVKEAALLLSCSESHIRKLVKLALKGKSRRPIPSVPMEGVTVFPLRDLLDWARPKPQSEGSLE